jgi:hypothetical protein
VKKPDGTTRGAGHGSGAWRATGAGTRHASRARRGSETRPGSGAGARRRGRIGRAVRIGLVVGAALLLTGCIDIFQYVGRDESGNLQLSVSVTIQKAIFEMASSFDGSAPPDYEEEFEMSEEEITGEYPEWLAVTYTPINTELEYGFHLEMVAPETVLTEALKADPADAGPFLPRPDGDNTVFVFDGFGNNGGEADEMAAAFFASAKYRMLIDENYRSQIDGAWFERNGERAPVDVRRYGDVWYLEFPMLYIFTGAGAGRLVIEG